MFDINQLFGDKPLITDADFLHAMLFKRKVSVWYGFECLEQEGNVEAYTHATVIINGQHFSRRHCEFRIVSAIPGRFEYGVDNRPDHSES